MSSLKRIGDRIADVLDQATELDVAGAVVGMAIGDEQIVVAHGTANLNTGEPFTEDTGFLLGSVTKILTTTILLRLVDRGIERSGGSSVRGNSTDAVRRAQQTRHRCDSRRSTWSSGSRGVSATRTQSLRSWTV